MESALNNNWRTNYTKYRQLLQSLLEKREDIRAYLSILLSLATVAFFGVFALRPTLTTIGELVSQINSERQILATLDQKIKNLETAKTNLQKIKADLPVLDQAIPAVPDPHLAVRQIETLAAQNGVTPINIALGKTPLVNTTPVLGAQTDSSYPFSFAFNGEAQNLLSFLNNLKSLRRIVMIDGITINRKAEVGSSDLVGNSTLQLIISGDLPYITK
ncbi:type 4a pilus biogenesis protein PilO [Candidatus Microgenomates bacterium]|nr:type 4a pilus biogenesis protein PilO [Candidatus Microgenomates bacterium]